MAPGKVFSAVRCKMNGATVFWCTLNQFYELYSLLRGFVAKLETRRVTATENSSM